MVGFSSSSRFVEHETGPHHPERPDRIRAILRAVREAGLIDSPDPFPDFQIDLGLRARALAGATQASPLLELSPTPADERWIRLVHPQQYIDRIRHICA